MRRDPERNWWVHAILGLVSAIASLPVMWIVLTAFMSKETAQSTAAAVGLLPHARCILRTDRRARDAHSSCSTRLIVAISSTVLSVTLGMFCAYALARYDFAGKDDVAFWILTNRMMPAVAIVLPMFLIFQTMNLLDTRIRPHQCSTLPCSCPSWSGC
jgi:multiple sugar transport system permease protein